MTLDFFFRLKLTVILSTSAAKILITMDVMTANVAQTPPSPVVIPPAPLFVSKMLMIARYPTKMRKEKKFLISDPS